jgi:hypothetical protein
VKPFLGGGSAYLDKVHRLVLLFELERHVGDVALLLKHPPAWRDDTGQCNAITANRTRGMAGPPIWAHVIGYDKPFITAPPLEGFFFGGGAGVPAAHTSGGRNS